MKNKNRVIRFNTNFIWIIFSIINLLLIFFLINTSIFKESNGEIPSDTIISNSKTPDQTFSFNDNEISSPNATVTPDELEVKQSEFPLFIISIFHDQVAQLYVYNPDSGLFTRFLDEPYEERDPAISVDKKKLAYSAKKNGYWDIYTLDLENGQETRITDTPEYDGSPSWSSDGFFLAYETYKNENLDIYIQDLQNLETPPIQLTNSDTPQFSPAWSPNGREIAFVSTEDGDEEIWLAKLDTFENRFTKVADRPNQIDIHPYWSADGQKLLWTSENFGYPIIMQVDLSDSNLLISELGIGGFSNQASDSFSYIQMEANQNFLIHKDFSGRMLFPSVRIPGSVHGMAIIPRSNISIFLISNLENNPNDKLNLLSGTQNNTNKNKQAELVLLENIDSTYPYLSSEVIEPFNNLRNSISTISGWDLLKQLNNTFVPLTEPSLPGVSEDWLYTGRAFEFNPLSIYAGLTTTIKEERNGQSYWRVFIKARYQDGSQGLPLRMMPFDLSARYNNDPKSYERGGKKIPIPSGYWIDLTEIALSHSWERLPAVSNWQSYFDSARFNQFALLNGMDWYSAMKELYPTEAIKLPTPIPTNPLTPTVSPTIRYYRSPTASITPTETTIPTRRHTWTPNP